MKNIGRVVNLRDGLAEIAVGRHSECKRCGACLASLDPKQRTLLAANDRGAGIGNTVEIEVPPARAIGAAFLLFIAPLLMGLGAAYLGYRVALSLGWPEAAVATGFGCVALMLSLLILRFAERSGSRARMARIVRVLQDENEIEGRH
ncbi:MAG: SoxR reducing system RseC family protein [bacterium]|jgi:sigma-E factor negative regulatory protein RseC